MGAGILGACTEWLAVVNPEVIYRYIWITSLALHMLTYKKLSKYLGIFASSTKLFVEMLSPGMSCCLKTITHSLENNSITNQVVRYKKNTNLLGKSHF